MKASPRECRLSVGDAVNQLKSTLDDINNQKRQLDIVDKYSKITLNLIFNPEPAQAHKAR